MSKWFYSRNLVPSGVLLLWPLYFFFFFLPMCGLYGFPLGTLASSQNTQLTRDLPVMCLCLQILLNPWQSLLGEVWGLVCFWLKKYTYHVTLLLFVPLLYCQRIQEVLSHSGSITTNIEQCLNTRWSLIKPPICAKITRTANCNQHWPANLPLPDSDVELIF